MLLFVLSLFLLFSTPSFVDSSVCFRKSGPRVVMCVRMHVCVCVCFREEGLEVRSKVLPQGCWVSISVCAKHLGFIVEVGYVNIYSHSQIGHIHTAVFSNVLCGEWVDVFSPYDFFVDSLLSSDIPC